MINHWFSSCNLRINTIEWLSIQFNYQAMTGQERASQNWSGQDMTGHVRISQDRTGQDWTSQVRRGRTGQYRTQQDRTVQDKTTEHGHQTLSLQSFTKLVSQCSCKTWGTILLLTSRLLSWRSVHESEPTLRRMEASTSKGQGKWKCLVRAVDSLPSHSSCGSVEGI